MALLLPYRTDRHARTTWKGTVDTAERLAAYLAGDLDAAATAAVEEDLARDGSLRERLAAMRRADAALDGLTSPRPSAGFEDRLRAGLEPVLAERLGTAADTHSDTAPMDAQGGGPHDELATRRAARAAGGRNRWMPALAGVAAAAAAIAVLTNVELGGQDTEDSVAADDADGAETFSLEAESDMADDGAAGAAPVPDGPVVVTSGRDFDEDEVETLLGEPDLLAVAEQHWGDDIGPSIADSWSAALGAAPADAALDAPEEEAAADDDAAQDEAVEEQADEGVVAAPLREVGPEPLSEDDRVAVARCLTEITEAGGRVIPAYVELGTYDGADAIVYGLVSVDPETGAFTRTELWVMGRDDCGMRYVRQN